MIKPRRGVESMKAYVPGEQPQEAGWVKLNTNECPYPPSPKVLEAIKSAANEKLRLYPDPISSEFRNAIYKAFNVKFEQTTIGNGSDELIDLIIRTFVNPDEQVLSCYPSYGMYPVSSKACDVQYKEIELKEDFTFPIEKIVEAQAKLTFICNPNSPTGTFLANKELRKLLSEIRGVVVVDEAYNDFAEESAVELVNEFDNLIVIRTLSKSASLAGMRIGYAIGDKYLIDCINRIKPPYNLDRIAVSAGVAALEDIDYIRANSRRLIASRKFLTQELSKLSFKVYPSQANFILVKCEQIPAKDLYLKLKDRKILIRYWDKPRLSDCVRITIGSEEENEKLITAVKGILGGSK